MPPALNPNGLGNFHSLIRSLPKRSGNIYRKTGWRHSIIADLTAEQIDMLETVDPWVAPKDRAPAQDEAA